MVGFPIVRHEGRCVAIFRLLEQECREVVNVGSGQRPIKPGQKGLRELRGLVSTINYDGPSSHYRELSNNLRACGNYK